MQRRIVVDRVPVSWPERILAGLIMLILVVLGFFFGLVVLGLAVAFGLGVALRIWWLRRRLRRAAAARDDGVIEGEYQVTERRGTTHRGDGLD